MHSSPSVNMQAQLKPYHLTWTLPFWITQSLVCHAGVIGDLQYLWFVEICSLVGSALLAAECHKGYLDVCTR